MFSKPANFKPYAAIKNSERKQTLSKIEQQLNGLPDDDSDNKQKLLPKNVQSAKAITHGEEKITVYADSQVPVWVIPKQGTLVPTVDLLNSLPDDYQLKLLPSIYTVGRTLQFLQNGADFMVPGIFGELPGNAPKGSCVAIRDLDSHAVLATGIALVDLHTLNPETDKGKCVQTVSVVGDKLNPKSEVKPLQNVETKLETKEVVEDAPVEVKNEFIVHTEVPTEKVEKLDLEPLKQKEVDEAFMYALEKSIREPHEYPMTTAAFSSLLNKHFPYSHQDLIIKNTSFGKMNKLIKHAEKLGLLNSRERNGGELVVTGVNVPVTAESSASVALPSRNGNNGKKSQPPQARMVAEVLYKPHPNIRQIAPNLPANALVDATTLKKVAFEYILNNKLAAPGEKSIPLNEPLRKALSLKIVNTHVDRDDVGKLMLKSSSPFHRIIPLGADADQCQWEKGGLPSIQIKTERRGGNKTVTLVGQTGLTGFKIDPQEFADELRHACAGSAALTDTKGFPAITVQGNHVAKIVKVLEQKGIKPSWIKQ